MPITGPMSPGPSTTRQQSRGRAAARERWQERASRYGLDGTGKVAEATTAAPADVAAAEWWLDITGATDTGEGVNRFDYTIAAYPSAFSTTAITGLDAPKARNIWEFKNTGFVRAGYTVTPDSTACSAIVAIKPIGNGRVKCLGFEQLPGTTQYRFIFQQRNDPTFYGGG